MMSDRNHRRYNGSIFVAIALFTCAIVCMAGSPAQAQRRRKLRRHIVVKSRTAHPVTDKLSVLQVVKTWETAYEHKQRERMLMTLMEPSEDAETLEKRYQWLRGYGPHDMPGSRHPPILFDNDRGSFVPGDYKVLEVLKQSPTAWRVTVAEHGTYHDEDGNWKVERQRDVKVVKYNNKWYVADYVLRSNTEDYGFYVDDIADTMVKAGH
ncbi:MAG: hypothetical protein KGJ62_08320 [Armatimonadetes bacterium]|nr:hypothetical protein [Armatimonadota bacterium]MDE2207542.1 hypothetical protein [Armatimonadota bacterium]